MIRSLLSALVLLVGLSAAAQARPLLVFAAASLGGALQEVAGAFTAATGTEVVISAAGSSALARQIQQGAPADLFVSANRAWMEVLAQEGLLAAGSRVDLLSNRLVLIGADPSAPPVDLSQPGALAARLNGGRLAVALVEAVPAGMYAKAALTSTGHWPGVAPSLAQADNVRAALALVAAGAAPLGIVYATDAAAEPRVGVLARFPVNSHPPITYPLARLAGSTHPQAEALWAFLQGPEATALFRQHGFTVLADQGGGAE